MARLVTFLALALALSGCANVVDTSPSYLGMSPGTARAQTAETAAHAAAAQNKAPDAVKHVSSNRVLSAMAFQKVTGAEVAPERLVNRAP